MNADQVTQAALYVAQGLINDLPTKDKEKVLACAVKLRETVQQANDEGVLALMLVSCEYQLKIEEDNKESLRRFSASRSQNLAK